MAFINIFISKPAKLNIKNKQLEVVSEITKSFPIEDINSIIIDSLQVNITAYTLSELIENKVAIVMCNQQHLPNGIMLPCNNHSRQLKILKHQMELPLPIKKQLWQQIIKQKIFNQASVLKILGLSGFDKLEYYSKAVLSNDSTNLEATAANFYFKKLFGQDFTRSDNNILNAALNYGYTILRSIIARTIIAYGLEPVLGLFHKSELNNFNLADDIIEPFRPVVDLFVAQNKEFYELDELTPKLKASLVNLLNVNILINKKEYNVSYAIEEMIKSLQNAIIFKKGDIELPSILDLKLHSYE